MIFVDDETSNCTCNSVDVSTDTTKEKLDALQTTVDGLNGRVDNLTASVAGFNASIQNSTAISKGYANNKVRNLRNDIEYNIASSVNTTQVIASTAIIDSITSGTGITAASVTADDLVANENLVAPDATLTAADIENANITEANITTADVTTLNATNATVTNLNINNLDIESIEAEDIEVDEIIADVANIKSIVTDLVSVDNTEYVQASGVDNTHLFKLTIPFYSGITNIIEQNDDFNIVIINNTVVTYTQAKGKEYLKRIEINRDEIEFYFANISDAFWYKTLFIGSEETVEPVAETVDKSGVVFNIVKNHGTVIYGMDDEESGIMNYVILDTLPTEGIPRYLYVIRNDNTYIYSAEDDDFVPLFTVKAPTSNIDFATLLS